MPAPAVFEELLSRLRQAGPLGARIGTASSDSQPATSATSATSGFNTPFVGGPAAATPSEPPSGASSWPELNAALPDGGFPEGVIELAAPRALGGATSVALATIRAALTASEGAFCAWLDPEATLHAPGIVAAGVDLTRLLVVRPSRSQLAKIAYRVVQSGAFDVVVLDMAPIGVDYRQAFAMAEASVEGSGGSKARRPRAHSTDDVFVRRLSLVAEETHTRVFIVSDALAPRTAPWPVAMRLELARSEPSRLSLRIGKDRRGRVGWSRAIPFQSRFGTSALREE